MKDLILKAVKSFSLFYEGETVTVALSGGADSVSLLHALNELKDELGIKLNAAHLNHSIRGEEADRDENFVKELCKALNIELFCEKKDVPEYAKNNHLSLELAARELRYDFLNRVAVGKIATAHTASDNLETLLFNLSRGTALKGLCGIPPKRDNIIRPIIFCTRADVEKYCKENNLSFVTDSTNLQDDYSRNKLRHNAVPVLKQINVNVETLAVKTAQALSEDYACLEAVANEKMYSLIEENSIFVGSFDELHPAIAKRIIKNYFGIFYPEITLENHHIVSLYDICLAKKGKVNLPLSIFGEVKDGYLKFYDTSKLQKPNFEVSIIECKNVNNLFSNSLLDYDKIVGELTIRTRIEGDSIRLFNRGCTKSLKKLYCENKIPLEIRESLPVIADQKGVVWIYGIGVASRCAISKNTKKVYKIEVKDM